MIQVHIDPFLQQTLPDLRIGLVQATVQVRQYDPALWTMLEELSERLRGAYQGRVAADRPEIAATRRGYRTLGDDPTHYRPANEALLRRALSRRVLSQINTVVDINTFVSLESGFALGCYDLTRVQGQIVVRRGAPAEQYTPIGKPAVDASDRLVLADERGIFGSPTADAQRTMVTEAATEVLFVVFAFEATSEAVQQAVTRAASLLRTFCAAEIVGQLLLGA